MRKLIIAFTLLLPFSCCEKKEIATLSPLEIEGLNPFGVEDSVLVKDIYIVMLNEEKYTPILEDFPEGLDKLDSVSIEKLADAKFNEIKSFGSKYGLKLERDDVFMFTNAGFIFQDSSVATIKKILSDKDKGDISVVHYDYELYMQNSRARMQNGFLPLPQNSRARMQNNPNWGYDNQNFTSKAVLYLGGGIIKIPSERPTAKVWVIDSGIDANHQDLIGLVNMRLSRSFVDGSPGNDHGKHGTTIAGLIAAIPANKNVEGESDLVGMTGVSPGAELVSLKVFRGTSETRFSLILAALNHIGEKGGSSGDIVNLSLGAKIKNCNQHGISNAIKRMAGDGILFSIAAGNEFDIRGPISSTMFLPACIEGPGIFTVASFKLNYYDNTVEQYSTFSNFGMPTIDWAVPGEFIFTTYPENNKYAVMEGTSMSAAMMSGLLHLTGGTLIEKARVTDSREISYPIPEKRP